MATGKSTKTKTKPKAVPKKRAPGKPAPKNPENKPLTYQERLFVSEFLTDHNVERAAMAAGFSETMAKSKAYQWVSNGKVKPHVYAAIQAGAKKVHDKLELKAEKVLQEAHNLMTADATELIEYQYRCCRFCWGKGNRYQRTPGEMERDRAAHEKWIVDSMKSKIELSEEQMIFDEKGGTGWNPTKDTNPDCQECFGEGVGRALIKDTRNLSPAARSLYAGVKITKEGIEVKMHSKEKGIDFVGRHLSLWNDTMKHKGDADNPIQHEARIVIVPAKEKAKIETRKMPEAEKE